MIKKSYKPKGYWTFEKCHECALGFDNRRDFKKKCPFIYELSRKNGWLDEICLHMIMDRKTRGYWTLERCIEDSLKYETWSDFKKMSITAYEKICDNGWCDKIPLFSTKTKRFKWTPETCQEVALLCDSRTEFSKKFNGAYEYSLRNNLLDKLFSHMVERENLTIDKCEEISLKFDNIMDLRINYSSVYYKVIKEGWYEKLFSHMKNVDDFYHKRGIYVYEIILNDCKYAYVGVTKNFRFRHNGHKHKGTVRDFCVKKGISIQKPKILIDISLDGKDALIQETFWVEYYRENGWNILNIKKCASLGNCKGVKTISYTDEECEKESFKYKNRSEFRNKSRSIYDYCCKNGLLDRLFPLKNKNKQIIERYETCKKESLNYKTRSEFQKKSNGCYKTSRIKGWLDEFFPKNK